MAIPRLMLESGMTVLALGAAASIALTGDERLAIHLVMVKGVSVEAVTWSWVAVFVLVALIHATALIACRRNGTVRDGACENCPLRMDCAAQRWRSRAGLIGALAWIPLAAGMMVGYSFLFPAIVAICLGFGEFCIFTALSRHVPWVKSLR